MPTRPSTQAAVDIARQRLHNQQLAAAAFDTPGDVVEWMGAVQAQDFLGSLWAIGLRLPKAGQADIEHAVADKTIIRTWPMRGTLHFVPPADARWMLALLTPRVVARTAGQYRQAELDRGVFSRSAEALTKALQGGQQLTRIETYQVLERAGISAAGLRGLLILGRLAQEGLICFGPRRGKQPTFVLLDEWAPSARRLERDEALAWLARRYFTSHGPVTLQDFVWWSGLTTSDARAGLEAVRPELTQDVIDGQAYWLSPARPTRRMAAPTAYLLPAYDEYTVAYKDRSAVLDPAYTQQAGYGIGPTIVIDGQIAGTWKRTLKKETVVIETKLFTPLSQAKTRALAVAAERYGRFLGKPAVLA